MKRKNEKKAGWLGSPKSKYLNIIKNVQLLNNVYTVPNLPTEIQTRR